jgi:hypothetical protein
MTSQAEAIRRATDEYFSKRPLVQPGNRLLQSLHCPHLDVDLVLCFDLVRLDPDALAQLQASLMSLLRLPLRADGWSMANASLLAGVAHYLPWQNFAAAEDDAYTVATTLVYFLDDHMPRPPLVKIYATKLLNDWLGPEVQWLELPDVVTVCRHMFGDAWCELRLADVIIGRSGRIIQTNGPIDISRVVEMERPPFLQGLCSEQDLEPTAMLPDMALFP